MARKAGLEKSNKGLGEWFRERISLANLDYDIPKHANTFLFSLGGITLISFIILIVTGVILAQFYVPNPSAANGSIRVLMTEIKYGSLLRGLHFWAAQVAMITVILHLLRVFVYGSYKRPREINWLIGVGLFFGMVGLYYTGTILKWDQEAFEALAHSQEVAKLVGVLGFIFSEKFVEGVPLLTRMYTIHTSMLPLLIIGLLAGHLLLVKSLKISSLPWGNDSAKPSQKFSQHLYKLSGYGLIALGSITILAVLLPPEIGPVPVEGIEATKPPWLFLSIFSIENWTGLQGLIWASVILAVALIVVPFIDRAPSNNIKERKPIITLGVLAVVLAVALTVNAYVSEPEQHIGMEEVEQANIDNELSEPEVSEDVQDVEIEPKELDPEPEPQVSPEIIQLNAALAVIAEIEKAINAQDFQIAGEKAVELDKILDGINEQIALKDHKRADDIKEHVHELGEILEEKQPNLKEVNDLIIHSKESVEEARKLFE